jgi:response regulator RpfG family c-di-GMP phosphodiesterase
MKTPVVVCVDDEPAILAALRRVLRDEPYRLLTTGRPLEAMEWVLAESADVLIADQVMPDMTGLRLLELVRTRSPGTARVLLSGQSDPAEEPANVGAVQRLVRKPWDSEELKASIRDLISRV